MSSGKVNTEIQNIFDILQKGDENIKIHASEDVVLALGNTGAGKTTFIHFIAGDNDKLFSVEASEGSGDYIIVDKENKISGNSTLISQTLFPDLVVDPRTKVAFYDCPGFSDTRSPVHDISATYFVKKVIDSYKRIKLLLVVNYTSVRKGVDRLDFLMLLKHVTNIVKNVDKMRDSMAIIVSKVDNAYSKRGGNVKLVPDEVLIESIAQFLKRAKEDIQTLSQNSNSASFYDKAVKLIDIFLENDGKNYTKIGLFRRPDDTGAISKIPLLQSGKKHLENIIHNNTKFILRDKDDIGYSISAESKNYIHDLGKEINLNIEAEISSFGASIEKEISKEEDSSQNIYDMFGKFKLGSSLLSKYEQKLYQSLPEMAEEIITDIKELKINIPHENLLKLKNFDQYLDFFNVVSDEAMKEPLRWAQGFKSTTKYLNHGEKWYNFLINLHNSLSKYNIQKNLFDYRINTTEDKNVVPVASLNLKPLIDKMKKDLSENDVVRMFDEVANLEIERSKVRALNRVLNFDLANKVELICEFSNTLIVRGKYVIISDIEKENCGKTLELIKIFATQKVFIDVDLNKIGQKLRMSIISPVWDIIGNRAFVLDGKDGYRVEKAMSGYRVGERGMDGRPGAPGGSGGSFFGMVEQVVGGRLTISADGGRGGDGQEGGDGAHGRNGDTPHPPSSGVTRTIFDQWGPQHSWQNSGFNWDWRGKDNYMIFGWYYYIAYGKPATDGADAGDGGAPGKGGLAGLVILDDFNNSPKVTTSSKDGMDGDGGEGGSGGFSAENGYNRYVNCRTDRYILVAVTYCSDQGLEYNGRSRSGRDGQKGNNYFGRLSPEKPADLIDPPLVVKQFRTFRKQSFNHTLGEPYIRSFYNKIDMINTSSSRGRIRTRERRDLAFNDSDWAFPKIAVSGAGSIHKSSILEFARSSVVYALALCKYISPSDFINRWRTRPVIEPNVDIDENEHYDAYNKFKPIKDSDISHYNSLGEGHEFTYGERYNIGYLINDNRSDNDLNINLDRIPLSSPSNLLLWDLLIRKFGCHKFARAQTSNPLKKDEICHDLAYRYYSPSTTVHDDSYGGLPQFEDSTEQINLA